jgi:hypothetical protein
MRRAQSDTDGLGAAVPLMVVWRYMVFDSRSCGAGTPSCTREPGRIREKYRYRTRILYMRRAFLILKDFEEKRVILGFTAQMKSMRPPLFRSPRVGVSSRAAAAAFWGTAVWVTFAAVSA